MFQDIAIDFHNRAETILSKPEKRKRELEKLLMGHLDKIKDIRQNYSFDLMNKQEKLNGE